MRDRQDNLQCFDNRPTKVVEPVQHKSSSTGQSAWNTAGTWEDKTLSFSHLQKVFDQFWTQATLMCDSVKVLRGEGSLITVRGKRKLGYELDIELLLSNENVIQLT